jgi:hypothetical protein
MPFFHACSTAYDSGSTSALWVEFVPYARVSTRMFRPLSSLCWTTQSIAAITELTSTPPSAVPTFKEMMRASGAIPR